MPNSCGGIQAGAEGHTAGSNSRAEKLENLAGRVRGLSADERTHIGKLGTRSRQAERASRTTNQSSEALP